jgi:hypothetical protein
MIPPMTPVLNGWTIPLKSRGLGDSATLPVGKKLLKNYSERTYEA